MDFISSQPDITPGVMCLLFYAGALVVCVVLVSRPPVGGWGDE